MPDAIHRPVAKMSEAAMAAFPGVDYLVTVQIQKDDGGNPLELPPIVTVHVNGTFKPVRTDFTNMEEIPSKSDRSYQLLPKSDEMLQLIGSNATVQYCVNRPRWLWLSMAFTKL